MKKIILFTILFSSVAFAADEFPNIKEGLWESEVTEKGKTQTVKNCFGDEASLKKMLNRAKTMMKGMCDDPQMKKAGDSYTTNYNCDMGIAKLTVSSVATGDFSSQYKIETVSKMTPPMMGQAGGTSTAVAKYVGPCEAGMKPGDVVMADGKKMNIDEMTAQASQQMQKVDFNQLKEVQKQMQEMMKQNSQ